MEHSMNKGTGEQGLSEATISVIAGFARLGAADRTAALQMLGITRGTRVWTPRVLGALPTLTGLVHDRDREAIYGSSAWAADYRPVRRVIAYVLQAQGLATLSASLGGQSLAKVGTSTLDAIGRRRADLGSAEYGAWYRGPRRYERDAGFEAFLSPPRLQLAPQHPLSPVRLCGQGIEVGLPADMSAEQFEAAFNGRLNPLRLQSVVDSEAGRQLCAAVGVEPASLRRYYRARKTYKAATELTLLRPQADVGALARLCADIVIDAVLGLMQKRPVR